MPNSIHTYMYIDTYIHSVNKYIYYTKNHTLDTNVHTYIQPVNPSKRLTADQALHHPWLLKDGHELEKLNLDANLTQLRKHLASRKFKGAVKSVMAVNKWAINLSIN